jgi:hypothetical protein
MSLRVLVKRCEHDWKNHVNIVTDEIAEVFVVPEIEGALGNLRGQDVHWQADIHTWKCGLATDFESWLNSGSCTFANSDGSMTSKISSTSFRNMTSLVLLTLGQYRSSPRTT